VNTFPMVQSPVGILGKLSVFGKSPGKSAKLVPVSIERAITR
jgi:hypothetical protein